MFSLSPPVFTDYIYIHYLWTTYSRTHLSHLDVTKCKCESTSVVGVHISFSERYAAYGALIPGRSFFASRWHTGGPAKTHTAKQVRPRKNIIYHTIAKFMSKKNLDN